MYELPDGSGFFVATIGGPRDRGLIPWLKYTKHNSSRRWLFFWRMYRDAYRMSRNIPCCAPPLSRLQCLRYSWSVQWPFFWQK